MVRTTVTLGRIPMTREDDLRTQLRGAVNSRLEVVNFKPQGTPFPGVRLGSPMGP